MRLPSAPLAAWAARPVAILALALVAMIGATDPAAAQPVHSGFFVPTRPVECLEVIPDRVVFGGTFSTVGPATGGGAIVSVADGSLLAASPRVDGIVEAVISDGADGWFFGGDFRSVGGEPHANLAHVHADLSVDAWDPGIDGEVRALALRGSTLYAGGEFFSVGGQGRMRLAAIDVATAALLPWGPYTDGRIDALTLSGDGATVYVAGYFTNLGGAPRTWVGAVDATSGQPTAWNPSPNSYVQALASQGDVIYLGGNFTSAGGLVRQHLAAFSNSTGALLGWNPGTNGLVRTMNVRGDTLYVGGSFTQVGPLIRHYLAMIASGSVGTWAPEPSGEVDAIARFGKTIYVSGDFTFISGADHAQVAAIDGDTGAGAAWNPRPDRIPLALAAGAGGVCLGGPMTVVNAIRRTNVAADDLLTGALTPFEPAVPGVLALLSSDTTLFAGVSQGFGPSSLHAFSPTTGEQRAWDPDVEGPVTSLAIDGTSVYVGGAFGLVRGQSRDGLAEVDAASAALGVFAPAKNGQARVLGARNGKVFVSGFFSQIGGQTRNGFAELDGSTGLATAWNPAVGDGMVEAVAFGPGVVYVAGTFSSIGGQLRSHLAALDSITALATAWNPGTDGPVHALALDGTRLYVGGEFSHAGGEDAGSLVAVDVSSGEPLAGWKPMVQGGAVQLLDLASGIVIAGGSFRSIGPIVTPNLAVIGDATTVAQISFESVAADTDRVQIVWLATGAVPGPITVQRRLVGGGWTSLASVVPDAGGHIAYEDTAVTSGATYEYRLEVVVQGSPTYYGLKQVLIPVAPAPDALHMQIFGTVPSPATGARVTISFALERAAPVRIHVFDLAGREVATESIADLGAGKHTFTLGARLAPGLYVVQLEQRSERHSARIVVYR